LTLDGLDLDAGAESFATRGGTVAGLVEELGLADAVVTPTRAPAWVVSPTRAYPLPATGWLGIPLHPFTPAVRRVLGWRGALRAASDRWRPLRGVDPDITVGALVRDRVGNAVADRLVAPVIQGVYSRPIDDLPLAAIAPGLPDEVARAGSLIAAARGRRAAAPAGASVQSLDGGMHRLTEALAAQARESGAQVLTGKAVTALSAQQGRWRVSTATESFIADEVVLAVPVPAARALLPDSSEVWSDQTARHVALVTLMLEAPALDSAPRGTGVLAQGGVTRAKALTHATAKWPWLAARAEGAHVVRLSYAVNHPDDDMTAHALADASRLLGVALAASQLRGLNQVSWPDASPSKVNTDALPRGVTLAGSAAGLSGLAAIVAAS
jgi:oxygen-dependent protoporphyrinogen oxidase